MTKDTLSFTLPTNDGEILVWFFPDFEAHRRAGVKKSAIGRQQVKSKLKEVAPSIVLSHQPSGAPAIMGSSFTELSISHQGGWHAVYLANTEVGIDIQTFNDRITEGRFYYVNDDEEENLTLNTLNLHLIWCAKEAIYKKFKGTIVDLKNEVTIHAIDFKKSLVEGGYLGEKHIFSFIQTKNYTLVWL